MPKTGEDESRVKELERDTLDLKITNRAKDMVIDRMQKERDGFFEQLLIANQNVGALETKLLQIETPSRPQIEGSQNWDSSHNGQKRIIQDVWCGRG